VSDLVRWINYGNEIYPIQQPIFETRNVTTTVHVNDGETIVLGGLITDKTTTYEDKVPLLGSIPFVGRFFRTHAQTSSKANLVVFVTARLITSRGPELAEERLITETEKKRLEQRLRESKEEAGELAPGVGTTAIVE
jgi:type II secretory pathway component GspD/PulD (secretin)